MKQFLRSLCTLLMLVVWASGFAQEVTLDFTNSKTWNLPVGSKNTVKTEETYSNGTYSITINASDGHYLVGNKENNYSLLLGKANATLTLPAFDFDVEKIVLKKTTQTGSGKTTQNIYVGPTAVSTQTTSADKDQTYEIKADYQKAGNIYVLKVTNKYNTQFSKIEIYKAASSSTATTVSFPKESLNLIDGEEAAQGQAAVVKAGEKTLTGATVTYSFESADGIFNETLASDGLFSLKAGAHGTGKVTATFAGGEIDGVTYAKSSASYIVNYSAAKTPALAFSAANVTVKQGEEASFVKPTITFTDERGDDISAAADIIYIASPETVVKLDNEGNVTQWLAPGVATITATTEYGKNYYDASYTLTYEKVKLATTLTLNEGLKTTGEIGETLDCPAWTLKAGENVLSGKTVVLTSDNEDAVKVDGNQLKLVAAGSANITLSFNGDDDYQSSNVSYKLTVIDPNAAEVTFDFSKPAEYGDYEAPKTNGSATNLEEGNTLISGVVTITNVQNGWTIKSDGSKGTNKSRFHMYQGTIQFRVYDNAVLTLSAADGYVITGFVYNSAKGENLTASTGSYDKNNKKWTGAAKSIELAINDAFQFENMTVTYSKLPSIALDETQDNTETISSNADKTVNVTLTRTLTANVWNTICLPFDVTAEQIANVLKSAGNVKEFDREDANTPTIYFKDATTMTAGVPYLIKPTVAATELVFKGVTIKNVGESDRKFGSNYKICGTFGKYTMKTDGTELFLKTDGKFYIPAAGTATMKGFRAYFFVPKSTAGAALNLSFGEATGIDGVAADAEKNVKVYNVNGQYVGTSLDALPKGLYIVGGKKVLK